MAVAELMAICSVINTCCDAVKKCAETGRDLESIGQQLARLGTAQVDLQVYKNKKGSSLSYEESIQLALQKKQIDEKMSEIKDLFYWSGNADYYDMAIKAMADARVARIKEIKEKAAQRKRVMKYAAYGFLGFLVFTAAFLALLIGIKAYASELEPWKNTLHGIVYSYGIIY